MRFDRALLPPASLEFVVLADTHYMADVGDAPLEFEGRRQQGRRAGAAWAAVGALAPDFVVHLGDMVQAFPGRPDFEDAMAEALGQIEAAGVAGCCRYVVGNHDIGDRPDPTMPTRPVTAASLADWEQRFGPSWHAWEAAGWHFLALNSQLFNTDLPAAARQRGWLEHRLAACGDAPCVLFLHMPPYLHDPDEVWLGHYDNLGEPDRGWLLGLVRRHRVAAMFAGHVHFQFFDRIDGQAGACRYMVTPSTSFTRPGFSHLFTAAPPPEQGRDDLPKLGFFLCRLVGGELQVHRVRPQARPDASRVLLTPVAAPAPPATGFGLGFHLRHPLAAHTEVPVAWPSAVRQPVRDDYPLLACLEAGAGWVRAPLGDLANPRQARRLEILRAEGVALQAVALGEEEALTGATDWRRRVDRLEVQLPGRLRPDVAALRRLADGGLPPVLCPVLPGQPVLGKQHHRTRHGFAATELEGLRDHLAGLDAAVACRLDAVAPWDAVQALNSWRDRLVLLAEFPGTDEAANVAAVARWGLVAAALDAPLLLEPLVDLDRTMDVAHGVLDPCCNPRPAFGAARCVTALVRAAGGVGAPLAVTDVDGCQVAALGRCCWLVLPGPGATTLGACLGGLDSEGLHVCRLATAGVTPWRDDGSVAPARGPLLVWRRG